MELSIVIVSYKVPFHLMLCLESLEPALKNKTHEIFVVDNDSGDMTKSLLDEHFPYVNFIQNTENIGFARANNQAISKASGEYVCLINPDTVVAEDTFSILFKVADRFKGHGILGLQMRDGTGEFLPESKVNQLTPLRAVSRLLGFSNRYFNKDIPLDEDNPTHTLVGAFMFFKTSDYRSIKGLDERYFMYGEDIDLSHQFMLSGKQNYYIGTANIIHFKGESTLKDATYLKRFFNSIMIYFDTYYNYPRWSKFWIRTAFKLIKPMKKLRSTKQKKLVQPERILVLTDKVSVTRKIANKFDLQVDQLTSEKMKDHLTKRSMVIFDMESLNFKDVIVFMKANYPYRNSYRFKPAKQEILIGSDSRTNMGEIKHLKDQ